MSRITLSLIIRCGYDAQTDTTQVQIERVDSGATLHIQQGSFLLRCSHNGRRSAQRCLIRHIASGREAHIQVGPGLRDFINACLMETNEPTEPTSHA